MHRRHSTCVCHDVHVGSHTTDVLVHRSRHISHGHNHWTYEVEVVMARDSFLRHRDATMALDEPYRSHAPRGLLCHKET